MRVRAWASAGIGELQPTNKNYGARSSRYAMVLDKDMKVEVVLKVRPLPDCLRRTRSRYLPGSTFPAHMNSSVCVDHVANSPEIM